MKQPKYLVLSERMMPGKTLKQIEAIARRILKPKERVNGQTKET